MRTEPSVHSSSRTKASATSNVRDETMTLPSDDSVRDFLRRRNVAPHLVTGGSELLIAGWRHFVGQVETGYPLGLDDYRNDLDLRSLIEDRKSTRLNSSHLG